MLLKYLIKSFQRDHYRKCQQLQARKRPRKARKQNKKRTENRKQVHMYTGNRKVGKYFLKVNMTDRNRSQNYYERENYNTFQDHRSRRNYKYHYKDKYERGFYNTFQNHGNRTNSKDHHKDKYRDGNFYDSDRSYDMGDSHGRDRSYSRDRPYSRDRSQDYCRDVYKEESYKYKRRFRDYYEDIYENKHGMDKYECQFRNDRYEIIRGRPKEKPCSHSDQSYDSFYSELEK